MADSRRIPTPFVYRWRRFLQRILPFIIFVVCVALTMWLWNRQSQLGNAVGTVGAVFVDVPAPIAGNLLPPPPDRMIWERFQPVGQDDIIGEIAIFDDRAIAAQIETLNARRNEVKANALAQRDDFLLNLELDVAAIDDDRRINRARQRWELEALQLSVRDREVEINTLEVESERLKQKLVFLNAPNRRQPGAVAKQEIRDYELLLKKNEAQIEFAKKAKAEAERLKGVNEQKAAELDKVPEGDSFADRDEINEKIRNLVDTFQKQLDVIDAEIEELRAQMLSLVVAAPISGIVTEVFKVPGMAVQPGDPILRIASPDSQYVITYIRHRQRIQPEVNTLVKLRKRYTGYHPVEARVLDVGPAVEPVPLQHLSDPTVPEWGRPVKIDLPPGLDVRPGESVDIIFPSRPRKVKTESVDAANPLPGQISLSALYPGA
jgi:hypothetical protein